MVYKSHNTGDITMIVLFNFAVSHLRQMTRDSDPGSADPDSCFLTACLLIGAPV